MNLKKNIKHKYTLEEEKFLIKNVKGISLKQLVEKFNAYFNLNLSENAIKHKKTQLKLSNGINEGRYKKGNIPYDHRQVGSERISKEGYIKIKVAEPNKWQLKHRYLYEQANGEIPKGYKIIFLDGNKKNISLSNLSLVKQSEIAIMHNKNLFTTNKNLTNTGTIIANVICKTNELLKKEGE